MDLTNPIIAVLFLILVFLIILGLPLWFSYSLPRKLLTPLLSIIQGRIEGCSFTARFTKLCGTWQRENVEVEIKSTGFRSLLIPKDISISLYKHFPFSFLRILSKDKEGSLKFIVLASPQEAFLPTPKFRIKISEDELDINRSSETAEEEKIRDFLTLERREIIHNIFKRKFNYIEITNKYIKIGMRHTTWRQEVSNYWEFCKKTVSPEAVNELLENLREFSSSQSVG